MKFKNSLLFNIIISMLVLAIIPLIIVSYSSYHTTKEALVKSAKHELQQSSILNFKLITNWFYYRELDIKGWSEQKRTSEFLVSLENKFKKSNQALKEFIRSNDYLNTVSEKENDLISITMTYSYVYDLFLIDTNGNILYTVGKESDLGTNLLSGAYSSTKLAKAYKQTLKNGSIHFSDLEDYNSYNNTVAGFLTSLILDKNGDKLGVLAVKITAHHIFGLFETGQDSYSHYIVGEDGFLRSKINRPEDVLRLKVNTKQFNLWVSEHVKKSDNLSVQDEIMISYVDLFGKNVFGLHHNMYILGTKWALISEVSSKQVLSSINKNKNKILILFTFIFILVLFLALFIGRRIVKPIRLLSSTVKDYSDGKRDINIQTSSNDEIGYLTRNFINFIDTIQENEDNLKIQTKEAKKALKALNEQQYALDAHSIVAITDVKGNITFVNDKFVEISGYSQYELIGSNHRIIKSGFHNREFWTSMYKVIANKKIWNGEICNISKKGNIYWVDTTIIPFIGENNKIESYIAIRTDITYNKESEEKLIKANEVALQSVKIKSEFLASMSHEIRTPMNGVIGMLNLLMDSNLDDTQKHQASLAQSSANALLALINDILDFSKIDAGKMDLEFIDFNLREELGKYAEAAGFKAQEKGIELILDTTELEDSLINADFGRIRQILSNIVGNAIKFTNIGYVLIKVKLIKTDTNDPRLIIEMSDSGIGIKADKIDTLFDSFSQADSSTTRKYGGTGLGLAIVKKLVHLMNGEVYVQSEYGKGSIFTVNISVNIPKESISVLPNPIVKGKKVLIFDKCEYTLEALKNQLTHWEIFVDIVNNEIEMLQKLSENDYDILFIDMITSININKLLEKLNKEIFSKTMKIVVMTPLKDRGDTLEFEKLGVDTSFPKPATTNDLMKALGTLSGENYLYQGDNLKEVNKIIWDKDINILLVEDNLTNQIVANGILETLNLEADIANNGQEALDILNKGEIKYDIILMDCQMPIMDGYTTTENIRDKQAGESYEKIPIIAMTANAMQGDKEKCFSHGMDDYVSKPIDVEILKKTLKKWLSYEEENIKVDMEIVDKEILNDEHNDLWNKDDALDRLGNSQDLLKKIVKIFIEDIQSEMEKLSLAYEEENIDDIKLYSHTIKGSSANISAIGINKLAKEINITCIDKNIEELSAEFIELKDVVKATIKVFEEYLDQSNVISKKVIISQDELLSRLKTLHVEISNGEFIDTDANDLFFLSFDDFIEAKIKELKIYVDDFKNDEALIIIASIIQKFEG